MKRLLLLTALPLMLLASCSTQYKTTQTPDDVYYSPAPAADVARNEKKQEDSNNRPNRYQSYTSAEDRYLRMKVANYNRWSSLDDYSYWYDTRYNDIYGYNGYSANGFNTFGYSTFGYNNCACSCFGTNSIFNPGFYNPYFMSYNSYYGSPYFGHVYYVTPKVKYPNTIRPSMSGYNNTNYSNTNTPPRGGGFIKSVFGSGSSSNNGSGTFRSTERTYSPSSSSSSSSSSSRSSSSGGSVSRPSRN